MNMYDNYYSELRDNRQVVLEGLQNEKVKFNRTLEKGLREFEKVTKDNQDIDGAILSNGVVHEKLMQIILDLEQKGQL